MEIHYQTELAHYGFDPIIDDQVDWINVKCPYTEKHSDSEPSCGINRATGLFNCFGCKTTGTFAKLLARQAEVGQKQVQLYLDNKYGLSTRSPKLNIDKIEDAYGRLLKHEYLLKELADRGVTPELITKYRLGEYRDRIEIPIANKDGLHVTLKSYKPGASKRKFFIKGGQKDAKIYPVDQLEYQKLVLCGGELKALAIQDELNPLGVGAISLTCGEPSTASKLADFAETFQDLKVWVCFDIDKAGLDAAEKSAAVLQRVAAWVGVLDLRGVLDKDTFPKGDISDLVGILKKPIYPLLEQVEAWSLKAVTTAVRDIEHVEVSHTPLASIHSPKLHGKALNVKALITAISDSSYAVPGEVRSTCDRAQAECILCPVYAIREDHPLHTVPKGSRHLLEMVGSPDKTIRTATKAAIGVPESCGSVTFETTQVYKVEEIIVTRPLDLVSNEETAREVYASTITENGELLEANQTYQLLGRPITHPKDQSQVFLTEKFEPIKDSIENFEPDYEILREYPIEVLEQNLADYVTRIYGRSDLHLMVDLAYHSPLYIPIEGRIEKGTVEVLIVGDTSQGKTEVTKRLQAYYGVGDKMDCSNTSRAGLVGGLEQRSGRGYFQTWGVIPRNDRGLVILEEFGRLDPECLSQLTDMRSSSIAELTKIKRGKTLARTRLICIANPKGARKHIGDYVYGFESISTILGDPAELRRFDACMTVSHTDLVGQDVHNREHIDESNNTIPQELYRQLVLWSWTREPEQIVFEDYLALKKMGQELSSKYSEDVPIIDKGSVNLKLARLSAALACRVFSHDPDDVETVVVKTVHVEYIRDFLHRIYSAKNFGYDAFSEIAEQSKNLMHVGVLTEVLKNEPMHDPIGFNRILLATNKFDFQDLQDFLKFDRLETQNLVSELRLCNAITRSGNFYVKTSAFIEYLKNNPPEPTGKLTAKKDHIP